MKELSSTARTNDFTQLADQNFDVLVIGGGVTGAGVALDAVMRGYRVTLVEKTDFASGTSSKSTKLVHGGIRYLPNFDFGLVYEALTERRLLLQNAPFLVEPIEFVLPMYEGDLHPVGMPFTTPKGVGLGKLLNIGLTMYDSMAGVMTGKSGVKWHRHLSREQVLEIAPTLVQKGLKDGYTYYDAQTNDARLNMALIRTAAQYGAVITNYSEVTSLLNEGGKIKGAVVHDRINNRDVTVHARHVINAAGVFANRIEEMTGTEPMVSVEPSKGVHLVLSRESLKLTDRAIVLPETDDKRILFVVPWGSRAIFGTTDTGKGDLDHPTTSHEDIAYLLHYLNRYLNVNLSEDDIISTYSGYRPLVKPRNAGDSTAKLSRSHSVLESPSGLVTIVGGKLTTYRRMAQDTMDVISKRDQMKPVHTTASLPLQGSAGWNRVRNELDQRGAALGLSSQVVKHLGASYGSEAHAVMDIIERDPSAGQILISDLPYVKAEILHAVRQEMAQTPADVLSRRTSITLEDRARGLDILEEVADMMANELGWSSERRQELANSYRKDIEYQLDAEKDATTQKIAAVAHKPEELAG